MLVTERYNNKILSVLKNDIFTYFFKVFFFIFNDFHPFTLSNRTYQYFKVPHERERRRKNLKWCFTRKKLYVGRILWKTVHLKNVSRWIAKRFSAMVLCCPNEGRNVNVEIAPGSLKTLIATISLIIFSIKILWYKKHQFYLRKVTSCILFLYFTNFSVS